MYIWIHDKYSSTASNSDYGREKLFSYDKINVSNHVCHCVVQWSRSCVHVQINRVRLPATMFSVSLYRFFFSCFFFFDRFFSCPVLNTIFPFGTFFFILTAYPGGHALGSIYILSLSPEFYLGKGISKALDMHTGQAYDQIKTISCQARDYKGDREGIPHIHPIP